MIVHGGLVARLIRRRWLGVLITGPSGSGKSDLALRLVEAGFSLVSDDRTLLWTSGGALFGRAPDALAGLVEARGVGVVSSAFRGFAPIGLVIDCDLAAPVERLPDPGFAAYLGHKAPRLVLRALEASAPAKIARALMTLG